MPSRESTGRPKPAPHGGARVRRVLAALLRPRALGAPMRVIALAVVLVTLMPLVAQSQQSHPRDDHRIGVSVLGEVPAPGRYEFKNCTTILDAIARAGGLTHFASRSEIVLFRREGLTMKRIPYNWFWWEERGEDVCLHQGDIIRVQ